VWTAFVQQDRMAVMQLYRAVARMQICAAGISVGGNVGSLPSLVREFSQNRSGREFLHCRIASHNDLLWRTIKRLLPPYPPRMTCHANFA
jgi:hypothetical protein